MSLAFQEKKLAISYTLCAILGAIASITTGIAWGHWKPTLDQCVNGKNCSCILYGQHTPSKFLGGSAAPCVWVTFGPLFYVLFAVSLAGFHGYRVLFSAKSVQSRTVMGKNDSGEMVEIRAIQVNDTNPLPSSFWLVLTVLTAFWTIYSIIHFAIFVDGFYTTCYEYRKTLERILGLHGTAIPVIHGRLSCQSIFDFMDYLQPDSGNAFRDGFIYTGADLIIGIVSACFSWILFLAAAYLNFKLYKSQN